MENLKLSNLQQSKIAWTGIISEQFSLYSELDSLVVYKYNYIKKNDENRYCDIFMNCVLKYDDKLYVWGENGVVPYKKDEDGKFEALNTFFHYFVNANHSIKYYLRKHNKKISFSDFKREIIPNGVISLLKESEKLFFTRGTLDKDINNFLGRELISKIEARKMHKELFIREKDKNKKINKV